MNISTFSIKRSVMVYLITIAAVVIGMILFKSMPISYWPDFSAPVILINTTYPGASAKEVEDKVSKVIEKNLMGVSGIDEIESSSSESFSSIIIRFEWGTDMDKATSDISEKLDIASGFLPRDCKRPLMLKVQNFLPPSYQFSLKSNKMNEDELKKFFDEKLSFYFLKLKDVATVEINGGRDRYIAIEPNKELMQKYGISFDYLYNIIKQENIDLSAGNMKAGLNEFMVKGKARLDSINDIKNLPVLFNNNLIVKLKDIANIRFKYEKQRTIFKLNGAKTLGVSIRRKSDGNAVSLSNDVEYEIKKIKELYPHLRFKKIKDEADFIEASIKNVLRNTIIGAILASLIIFMFLGTIRSTFVIIISIPVSIIASIIFMSMFGLSINTISLGGLAMAVGMIVDSSIVMLENIERNLQLFPDKKRIEVFYIASKEVVAPIFASIMTSIVVFLPLAFLKGIASVLLGELALTVVFALSLSLIVSLTLVPLLTYKFVKEEKKNKYVILWNNIMEKLKSLYRDSLSWFIQNKKRSIALVLLFTLFFILTIFLAFNLETELIPVPDEGEFRVELRFSPSTSLDTNEKFSSIVRENIINIKGIDYIFELNGQSVKLSRPESNYTTFIVILKENRRNINSIMLDVRKKLEKIKIPSMSFKIIQSTATEGMVKPPLDVLLFSDNLDKLRTESDRFISFIKNYEGLVNIDSSVVKGKYEFLVNPDRKILRTYRLSSFGLFNELRAYYSGVKVGKVKFSENEYDMKIFYPTDNIFPKNIFVSTQNGLKLKLNDVSEFRLSPAPAYIKRLNQQRFAEITGELAFGSKKEFDRYLKKKIKTFKPQEGVKLEKRGASRGIIESFKSMGIALMLAIFLVYVVMGSQFNSFKQPFIISFTIPLAIIGVILVLYITSTPLNLNSFLGGVVLVGIVVNNGILLIDFINQKRQTMRLNDAILEGAVLRLRPILMTAFTTILGMFPLALGLGKGSESLAPLARAIVGGLTFSTITTLFVVPSLYFIFEYKKK